MASPAFEFVQGNERLDWGVLVSIDVERLMKSTTVDTLQRIVENIAFSRVTRDEAALFTPDHILHLFQLCQVVIQYLVYSQEILAEINVKLNDRMEEQQAAALEQEALLQRLSDESNLLKKQIKTQRRTLLAYEYNAQAALARGLAGSGAAGAAGGPATLYVCPYCGDEYHKAESMQSHLRKRHNTTVASPSLPVADTATSPLPPTAGSQTVVPAPARGPIATAEASEPLQQLRHRVEQLEKDKEVMERQQRENLILMMLGATRSQTTVQSPTAVNVIPEHLKGIPVVPDISAMMNYNLSCQREASENALRRQLMDLEAEIRALRASKLAAAPTDAPAVGRPAWVAELENAQKHQRQQQQQQSSPSATQPQFTSAAAPPIQSMPSLCTPPSLQSSSPAPQPSYNIQQQQQPSLAVPSPTPSVPDLSTPAIPIPSPATAPTTEGGAPPAATSTPSVSLPQPPQVRPKPYHWVDSSTNSSLTSTSTVPPHRAVSKGCPGASPSLTSSATPAMATAASTSATTIPLPSTASAGALAPSISSPGLGVGTYFSSRTSAPAGAAPAPAPLSVIPPPATHDSSTQHSPPPPVTAPELSVPHPMPAPALRVTNTPLFHAPSLPAPVLASSTGGGNTSVGSWSPPAPVPSTANAPVPTPSAVPGAVNLQRVPRYRDPLVRNVARMLLRGLQEQHHTPSSTRLELEVRLGSILAHTRARQLDIPIAVASPALMDETARNVYQFHAGISHPLLHGMQAALLEADGVKTAASNPEAPPYNPLCLTQSITVLSAEKKGRLAMMDMCCPGWCADLRFALSKETAVPVELTDATKERAIARDVWWYPPPAVRSYLEMDAGASSSPAAVTGTTVFGVGTVLPTPVLFYPEKAAGRIGRSDAETTIEVEVEINLRALLREWKRVYGGAAASAYLSTSALVDTTCAGTSIAGDATLKPSIATATIDDVADMHATVLAEREDPYLLRVAEEVMAVVQLLTKVRVVE
ncbi:Iguana/Dzip1-like DAZ-interacting protein N-terminal family protein [Leishmania donovani]|uniref:mRNA 5'-phosphatase n=1 Tax=Leishmania donovani TaxID=5661 RepID=A0A504Y7K7_LEIDO|nr:Iguana/Dzip1-like DAZ-interacting protein N-terminal family protein [Leishmania donovani]